MRRRDLMVLLGGAAAWPTAVAAQRTARIRRISVLMGTSENDKDGQSYIKALRQGLGEFGWKENNTIHLDLGWTDGDRDKARILAIDYVKLQPDLIFCHAGL
jgi:putative ABC transport system substrate-binding protein